MAKRKEQAASHEQFAKQFQELCTEHGMLSAVCISASKIDTATDGVTIGMGMCYAGSGLMHESLCAWGFGYSSGRHVQTMDDMKSYGRKSWSANAD